MLLKDCWEPHKGCLVAACGSRKCSWEPLDYRFTLPAKFALVFCNLKSLACLLHLVVHILCHCCSHFMPVVLETHNLSFLSDLTVYKPGLWIQNSNFRLRLQAFNCLAPAPEWFGPLYKNWKPLHYLYNLLAAPQTMSVERETKFLAPAPPSKIFWLRLQPSGINWISSWETIKNNIFHSSILTQALA